MIDRQEIMDFSVEFGLDSHVIEKDYVLGWILAGISNHPVLSAEWVFKGGTCLKKCYFETYRFSEDLDFTISKPEHINQDFLVAAFKEISVWVYDNTGIEIPEDKIRFDVYQNPRGTLSVEGRISYKGPMGRGGDLPRIKLDLTNDEVLVTEPVSRAVHHPYSDCPSDGIQINCYRFEEIFAEKIRALGERERPRDLYDVVHLYRHDDIKPDREIVLSTLREKCSFKGIDIPSMETLGNRPEHDELQTEWANMLAHQLQALPPFEQFWNDLPEVFEWLYSAVVKATPPAIATDGISIGGGWQMPAELNTPQLKSPMEKIRFAAANRLCIELAYQGSNRLIEPYALRRISEGNLVLHAVKHQTGEIRSYRVDRIQGARITDTPFIPRYTIELTATGPISAPSTKRKSSNEFGLSTSRTIRPRRTSSRRSLSSFGPKYIIECFSCGKRFQRKKYTTKLNPHKDKSGYPCSGRTGYLVDTKY